MFAFVLTVLGVPFTASSLTSGFSIDSHDLCFLALGQLKR